MASKNTRVAVIVGLVAGTIALTVVALVALQLPANNPNVAPITSKNMNDTLQTSSSLRLAQTIPLLGVKGRIDHMDIDIRNQRLFVAALGNDLVEVIDLKSGKVIRSIAGLKEPQGVLYVAENNRLFVSNGGDGSVQIFDADSFRLVQTAKFSDDADNLRYDPYGRVVYVGYGNGGLGMVNATDGSIIANIPLDGHPESFQLSQVGGATVDKAYANIPASQSIAIVDVHGKSVISKLMITAGGANYPMALDAIKHTLFVGLRNPPKLVAYDTTAEREIGKTDITEDPDDIFIDQNSGKVYVSSGGGFVDVIAKNAGGEYVLAERASTAGGARTSLLVPLQNRLYVAAPESASHPAQILVFEVQRIS